MSKVAVLDTQKNVLEPCHPAKARRLLREGKAAVYRRYPFTIILKREVSEPKTGDYTLGIDPGSRCTGLAITDSENNIVACFELHHRGQAIKKCLTGRAGHRRSRRTRKVRYRKPRFENRSRKSPRLVKGEWVYEKVPNTRKTENTFNRVSYAQLKDPRYNWVRIKSRTASAKRDKTRMYFANGKRMRRGDLYYEKDGRFYRYNSNNKAHSEYKCDTYQPKGYTTRRRWRRIFVGTDTAPRDEAGHRVHNGWVAPSLMSRIYNIATWVKRLSERYPISHIAVEHVKFDTQKVENPEISGEGYQGEILKADRWEYVLEKFGRRCYYCKKKNVPLTQDHVIPRAKDGPDRWDNIVPACRPCNQAKGNQHPNELDGVLGERARDAQRKVKQPMKDMASVNTIRWKIVETLQAGFPDASLIYGTGGKTKYHRKQADLPKEHYYDAACVASIPKSDKLTSVLAIHAVGYGHRQDLGPYQTKEKVGSGKNRRNVPGFKHLYTRIEHADGFQKLDMVEALIGGRRVRGSLNCFDKTSEGKPQKLRAKTDWTGGDGRTSTTTRSLRKIQKRDGYAYQVIQPQRPESDVPPPREGTPIPEKFPIQLTLFS